MKTFIVAVVIIAFSYLGYKFFTQSSPVQSAIQQQSPPSTNVANPKAQPAQPTPVGVSAKKEPEPTQELVGSIYDADIDFRQAAQLAAASYVAHFDPEHLARWRAVRVEPDEFLTGSYLQKGSIPSTFQISPFPDETFTVTETKYTIRDWTESVSWVGTIAGSDGGRVEIVIVGGVDQPEFVIRILNGSQKFAIVSTETRRAYVAMEINPHGPAPIL